MSRFNLKKLAPFIFAFLLGVILAIPHDFISNTKVLSASAEKSAVEKKAILKEQEIALGTNTLTKSPTPTGKASGNNTSSNNSGSTNTGTTTTVTVTPTLIQSGPTPTSATTTTDPNKYITPSPTPNPNPSPTPEPTTDIGWIAGSVLIGPTCPLVYKDGYATHECDNRPYETDVVVKTENGGQEVARGRSGGDGNYRISVSPGTYLVTANQNNGSDVNHLEYPTAQSTTMTVKNGETTSYTFVLDSGMR